jgi:WD40 repeat protein
MDQRVRSAVFSPNGKQILTANEDGSATLWDAGGDGNFKNLIRKQLVLPSNKNSGVRSAVFTPDGKQILTASEDSTVRL